MGEPDGPVSPPVRPADQRPLPPAARLGLLTYLTATSLDEDYAHVSRQRAASGAADPGRPGRAGLVVTAVFGILVATAAVQTARSADADQVSHDELVEQVLARKAELAEDRGRVAELGDQVARLTDARLRVTAEGRALDARLDRLGVATGASAARGPGITITTDDAPGNAGEGEVLDVDLQRMLNGLWLAGAEGVAVNGQRVTTLTAVRVAGASITVNLRPVSRPYVVTALGDPDTLATRFVDTPGGQWWLDLQALYGVVFEIRSSEESLTLPAASRLDLRYATTPEPAP